jgi:DNA-binding MarR family transcriptional regulator
VDNQPVEYIEVTLDDIEKANKLANEVLGQSLDELAKPSRTLLSLIYQMVKEHTEKGKLSLDDFFFNRRMIREYINWTDWQIKAHIKQLEEMEYLHVRMGAQGKQYCYALNYKGQGEENGKCFLNLTPVEEIRKLTGSDKANDERPKRTEKTDEVRKAR